MGVEVIGLGSLPDELNNAWPAGGDPKSEGDDHIRNIKTTLKNFYQVWVAADVEARLTALEAYVVSSDADTLNGQPGSYYLNASNLNAGTVPVAQLAGTYNIDINGTAANATLAATATNALSANNATSADDAAALGGVPAATVLAGLASLNVIEFSNPSVQNFTGAGWKEILALETVDIVDAGTAMAAVSVNVTQAPKPNIATLGYRPQKDIPQLYPAAHLFLEVRLKLGGTVVANWVVSTKSAAGYSVGYDVDDIDNGVEYHLTLDAMPNMPMLYGWWRGTGFGWTFATGGASAYTQKFNDAQAAMVKAHVFDFIRLNAVAGAAQDVVVEARIRDFSGAVSSLANAWQVSGVDLTLLVK